VFRYLGSRTLWQFLEESQTLNDKTSVRPVFGLR
jgi:hypothetical protein